MNTALPVQASLFRAIEPSNHSVSNHPTSSLCDSLVLRTTGLTAATLLPELAPIGHGVTWASPTGCRLATTLSRIEFVILRTGCSPPVALHDVSRQRSYDRLQSSDSTSTRTFTSQVQSTYKRTSPPLAGGRVQVSWPNRCLRRIPPTDAELKASAGRQPATIGPYCLLRLTTPGGKRRGSWFERGRLRGHLT